MKTSTLIYVLLALFTPVLGQESPQTGGEPSPCHVFIDERNIWTAEIVEEGPGNITPILNIITLSGGEWDFEPKNVHIYNARGDEARVERFSLDTGVEDEPYVMGYLKVRGNSFIGIDLLGTFDNFAEPVRIAVDLGRDRFQLQAIDCSGYDAVAEKIDRVNVDSPDIFQDFEVLRIPSLGERERRPEDPF